MHIFVRSLFFHDNILHYVPLALRSLMSLHRRFSLCEQIQPKPKSFASFTGQGEDNKQLSGNTVRNLALNKVRVLASDPGRHIDLLSPSSIILRRACQKTQLYH